MTDKTNMFLVSGIIIFTIIVAVFCIMEKKVEINKKNKNKVEHFKNVDNLEYTKLSETLVSIPKKTDLHKMDGNLDQCKEECNKDEECVGFVRTKGTDNSKQECHFVKVGNKENIIKNIVNCHNEYKEVSDNYLNKNKDKLVFSPDKYYNYDTYFKVDVPSVKKDNLLKCISLSQKISIIHKKHPFSYIILDDNNNLKVVNEKNLVMNKEESNTTTKFFGKDGVFEIVKGLNGQGISFKSNKYGEDYYIVHKITNEHLTAELYKDDIKYKESASFIIDLEYAEKVVKDLSEVRFVSLQQNKEGQKTFWKLNEITGKIVIVDNDDVKDGENLLFELVSPIIYNPFVETNVEENIVLAPAPSGIDLSDLSDTSREQMAEELEKLELDIRKSQHTQNIQLMNMMLDVNKFKLHDLSMSNYLTKCVGHSGEEIDPSFINQELSDSNLSNNIQENSICKKEQEIISPAISNNNAPEISNNNINNNINNNNVNNINNVNNLNNVTNNNQPINVGNQNTNN